jgi:hypothetical protein
VAVLEDKDFHENMACVRAPTRTKMKFEFFDSTANAKKSKREERGATVDGVDAAGRFVPTKRKTMMVKTKREERSS